MDKISILDCTLRDGGYINDFAFGRQCMTAIIKNVYDGDHQELAGVGRRDRRVRFFAERKDGPRQKPVQLRGGDQTVFAFRKKRKDDVCGHDRIRGYFHRRDIPLRRHVCHRHPPDLS